MGVRAALMGCGKRGRLHAKGLEKIDGVDLVAFADPIEEAAKGLREEFDGVQAFGDVGKMLADVQPELVAICTRPAHRLGPIKQCVDAGVKAIQCEKPMATSWNEAREIYRVCDEAGVTLAFTHQRRFRGDFCKAKQLIDAGAIGDVTQIQGFCPNFYDWGTHWFDMWFYLLGDIGAEWVLAQADFTGVTTVFDAPLESKGISRVCLEGGILGLLVTETKKGNATYIRALGDEGMIEIVPSMSWGVRMLRSGGSGEWAHPPLDVPNTTQEHGKAVQKSLAHLVACLESGAVPLHGSDKARKATELIFASFASAKRNERIDLPLGADDDLSLDKIFEGATFA